MEIIEFFIGCLEALLIWRLSLMAVIGVLLVIVILLFLGTGLLGVLLALAVFVGCIYCGNRWQKAYERGGVR